MHLFSANPLETCLGNSGAPRTEGARARNTVGKKIWKIISARMFGFGALLKSVEFKQECPQRSNGSQA